MSDAMVKPGQSVTFQCNIISKSAPTVTWSYVPCKEHITYQQCYENKEKIVFTVSYSISMKQEVGGTGKKCDFHEFPFKMKILLKNFYFVVQRRV